MWVGSFGRRLSQYHSLFSTKQCLCVEAARYLFWGLLLYCLQLLLFQTFTLIFDCLFKKKNTLKDAFNITNVNRLFNCSYKSIYSDLVSLLYLYISILGTNINSKILKKNFFVHLQFGFLIGHLNEAGLQQVLHHSNFVITLLKAKGHMIQHTLINDL